MKSKRASGILLHPTSFPGEYGVGDLGSDAYRWIDWLAGTGCTLWQILPLGPTGYGDSPYQCFSAFAGNIYLISPEKLIEEGLLSQEDLADMPDWNPKSVDFGRLFEWKPALLKKAYHQSLLTDAMQVEVHAFKKANATWLDDYALFMALKETHGGGGWVDWPVELRGREKTAMNEARRSLADAIGRHVFLQYAFYKQWKALKDYANAHGIRIIGDLPIFVAMDSSDVWARPDLFLLDADGKPSVVAGVPPDYFSPTGQLWGNPLYRWENHKRDGYAWWLERIRYILEAVDIVRIDHFRGFAGYWEIPGDAATAERGRWVSGPGTDFFDRLTSVLGDVPIIAEDLGEITPDVIALRDRYQLPGMKILQFAFSGPNNPFLPHQFGHNCVVYTGTHDNDTSRGWYESAPEGEKEFARRYFRRWWQDGNEFTNDLVSVAWGSAADMAIAPMQDLLGLASEARFNYPSRLGGNWEWRMGSDDINDPLKNRLLELNWLYQR